MIVSSFMEHLCEIFQVRFSVEIECWNGEFVGSVC